MGFIERADNIYMIDTKMFGFDHYSSSFLVKGDEIALVDTGMPNQLETVRTAMKARGFSPSNISYIFVTHGHSDHCGNVAPLLRDNPKTKVYVHPLAAPYLTNPSIEPDTRKRELPPEMTARFGEMEPVPPSCIQLVKDGDVFDLGDGEKLRIIDAPGHQPGSIVILEEKSMGLFIDDLVGNYFPDVDVSIVLTSHGKGNDLLQSMQTIRKLMSIPVTKLFLGHFGISDRTKEVMQLALNNMQKLLDIGAQCVAEGKPDDIVSRALASRMPELEKIRVKRGEQLYEYLSKELVPSQSEVFAKYYLNLPQNQ